jgi:hypothetical protein
MDRSGTHEAERGGRAERVEQADDERIVDTGHGVALDDDWPGLSFGKSRDGSGLIATSATK